ncbi:MAG: SDR family NAD(P)-dependent oxidoreductase [Cumulibacter sp.]
MSIDTDTAATEQVRLYRAAGAQERMWFAHEHRPDDRSYNVFLAFRLSGSLDRAALRDAVADLARAHEPLRTTFRRIDGALYQIVSDSSDVQLTEQPSIALDEAAFADYLAERAMAPFDLRRGPVCRVELMHRGDRDNVVLLAMHHIITDGRSLEIVCADLAEAYTARVSGSRLVHDQDAPQFGDYCELVAQDSAEGAAEHGTQFWRSQLSPLPDPLALPVDRLRPVTIHPAAERIEFALDADTSDALRATARRLGVPVSSLIMTAYYLVLSSWSGCRDLVIGMPSSGRILPDVDRIVGLFVNTLPIRIRSGDESASSDLITAVATSMAEAVDHEDVPLEEIVAAVAPPRVPGRAPLFDVLFTAQNTAGVTLELPGLTADIVDIDTSWTRHDLELNAWVDTPRIRFMLVARRSLFTRRTVESLADALRSTTRAIDVSADVDTLLQIAQPAARSEITPTQQQQDALRRVHDLPGVLETAITEVVDDAGELRAVALVASSTPLTESRVLHTINPEADITAVALVNALPAREDGMLDLDAIKATVVEESLIARWQRAGAHLAASDAPDEPPRTPNSPAPSPIARTESEKLSIASGGPAPHVEYRDLAEALAQAATTSKGITLIDDRGDRTRLSYADLYRQARQIAAQLRQRVTAGTPVVLTFRSNAWLLPRLWGCIIAGIPAMPWVPPLDEGEITDNLSEILAVLGESAVLAEPPLDEGVRLIAVEAGTTVLRVPEEPADSDAHLCAEPPQLGDALLLRTSGSTSRPKAVRVTHQQILTRSAGAAIACGLGSREVSLNWMPLDHVGGIVMFHLRDVVLGLEQVQVNTHYVLAEPSRWMGLCAEYRVSTTWAPNFAFGLAAENIADGVDLSGLRHILNGGEAVRRGTVIDFLRAHTPLGLPTDAVRPSWGMSETTSGETDSRRCRIDDLEGSGGPVPVGRLYPGFSIRILDAEGNPVPEGTEGRLEVSGPGVTPGYYRDQERTSTAFSTDGWFDTGDLATYACGALTIVGRASETIIINGSNFSCEAIEVAVERDCSVVASSTAALALPHSDGGSERVCIVTVPDGPASPELAARIRESTRRVTGHSADVWFTDPGAIPRTNIGKIIRSRLRQQLVDGELSGQSLNSGGATAPTISYFVPRARPALNADPRHNQGLSRRPLPRSVVVLGAVDSMLDGVLACRGLEVHRPESTLAWVDALGEHASDLVVLVVPDTVSDPIALTRNIGNLATALTQSDVARGLVLVARGPRADAVGVLPGLVRSLSGELADVKIRLVTVDDASVAELADEIVYGDSSITLTGTGAELRRTTTSIATMPPGGGEANLPRFGGAFVLTGGTGALGISLAEYLLSARSASVLLVSRQATQSASARSLRARRGADRVHTADADVVDLNELSASIDKFEASVGRVIDGAFHLAGGFIESPFVDTDDEMLNAVMGAKVQGARNLRRILAGRSGAELVLCSSVSGTLGAPFAAPYAAANSYLDSAAQEPDPAVRCRSIAWSMWRDTGLSSGFAHSDRAAERGTKVLEPTDAAACWPIALASEEPVVLIGLDAGKPLIRSLLTGAGIGSRALMVDGDPETLGVPTDVLGRRVEVHTADPQTSRPATTRPGTPTGRRGEVEQTIARHWREVLKLPDVDRTTSFFDLGGTSIHLSQIHEKLRDQLDPTLTLSQMFTLHTIAELSAHIARGSAADRDNSADSPTTDAARRGRERAERRRRRSR